MQASERSVWEGAEQNPGGFPHLRTDEVHVWRLEMPRSRQWLQTAETFLSDEERSRAQRFHFEKDRTRFTLCRGALRALLGRYVNLSPARIALEYGAHGKPRLSLEGSERLGPFEFNVSHSGDHILFVMGRSHPLGVDVEQMRQDVEMESLAKRFFSEREVVDLSALDPGERTEGFFNCWTRKEAYVKAHGQGLSLGLGSFAVTLKPGVAPEIYWFESQAEQNKSWQLWDLPMPTGYRASLATTTRVNPLRLFSFAPEALLS